MANQGTTTSFILKFEDLDFGMVIFEQIVDHSRTRAKLKSIGFPSLICSILIPQHPEVLRARDGPREDAKPLTITNKLMAGKHVVDVEIKGVGQSDVVPEGEVVALLIKAYEEEQQRLEAEIHLKMGRVSELKAKLQAMKTTVPPAVNDLVPADDAEPDAFPSIVNDPASDVVGDPDEISPSHV
ncbi:hypothetical protein LIER_20900 [Lithospermum erythrorhizon]|uniref:Uncharacterized protein n=1 Tax=Lithospermum erythrorhizon TaxID=34254 RepID=A0AAV3QRM7_LITER